MKFLMIDTETTNNIDDPIVYDIGFAVVDRTGKVYETHSYAIADVILDDEMMSTAYYAEKLPQYWDEIQNGKRLLRKFKTVKTFSKQKPYGKNSSILLLIKSTHRKIQAILATSFEPYSQE